MPITVFDQHLAIIACGRDRDAALKTARTIPDAHIVEWDVQHPAQSEEQVHLAADVHGRIAVIVPHAHVAACSRLSSIARKHGLMPTTLITKGADQKLRDAAGGTEVDDETTFDIARMPFDRRDVSLCDLIGDVHGCLEELTELLTMLGHLSNGEPIAHPEGRTVVFLGDLVDRGPSSLGVLALCRRLQEKGALMVRGNHDDKFGRWLIGNDIKLSPGVRTSIAEVEASGLDEAERRSLGQWLLELPTHLVLDDGQLIAAHAGLDEMHHGRVTPAAHAFALYGKAKGDGSADDQGHPTSADWAIDYQGSAVVVQGHVVHEAPRHLNNTWSLDTGCVFGGHLTAMRWPSRRIVQVEARRRWYDPHAGDA